MQSRRNGSLVRFYLNTVKFFCDIIIKLAQLKHLQDLISSFFFFSLLNVPDFYFSLILFAYFWNHVYNQEHKWFTIRAAQMVGFPV